MQNYSFKLSLRIWHPNINPDEISKELAITPNRYWQAGDQRVTPKGTVLKGKQTESCWNADPFNKDMFCSNEVKAEEKIYDLIKILDKKKIFLKTLREQGANILIQISSFGERNYAIELPPSILKKISDLSAGFAHDIYAYEQE